MALSRRKARKPHRPYHHGNLRRALLDEALATIHAEGVEGLTLREIGARVGVSRTALYRHFADKRALLSAVATEGFRTLRQRLVTAWEEGGRGRAAFESMGVAYIRFAVANPSHYRVMFGGFVDPKAAEPELADEASGAFQALVDALAELQRDAIVRGEDTVKMARFVWAVVHGVAMLGIDGQLREPGAVEELMQYAIERLRTGIEAATPKSSRLGGYQAEIQDRTVRKVEARHACGIADFRCGYRDGARPHGYGIEAEPVAHHRLRRAVRFLHRDNYVGQSWFAGVGRPQLVHVPADRQPADVRRGRKLSAAAECAHTHARDDQAEAWQTATEGSQCSFAKGIKKGSPPSHIRVLSLC